MGIPQPVGDSIDSIDSISSLDALEKVLELGEG